MSSSEHCVRRVQEANRTGRFQQRPCHCSRDVSPRSVREVAPEYRLAAVSCLNPSGAEESCHAGAGHYRTIGGRSGAFRRVLRGQPRLTPGANFDAAEKVLGPNFSMKVHHLNCTSSCPLGGHRMDGRTPGVLRRGQLSCHCLLLESRDGLILIDTGFGLRDVAQPRYCYGFESVRSLPGLPPEILFVPLPGHTYGHVGAAVQIASGQWLLQAGDAYFYRREMDAERPSCTPGLRFNKRCARRIAKHGSPTRADCAP